MTRPADVVQPWASVASGMAEWAPGRSGHSNRVHTLEARFPRLTFRFLCWWAQQQ